MTVVVHSRSEEVGWNRIRTRELPFKPRLGLARKMQECEPASSVLLPRDICNLRTCEIATMRHANVIASKTSAQNNSMWELFVIHESLQKSRYRYRMKRPLATNTNSCVVMRNTGVRCERHCSFFLPTFHIDAGALRTHGFIFEPDVFVIRRNASIT